MSYGILGEFLNHWWVSEGRKVEKVLKTKSVQDGIEQFKELCATFLVHNVTRSQQNAAFTEQKASSSDAKQKIFHFDI